MVIFFPDLGFYQGTCIEFGCLVSSVFSNLKHFLVLLYFMPLIKKLKGAGYLSCKMSHILDLSLFSWLDSGYTF